MFRLAAASETPLLSVVMPFLNEERWLPLSLSALFTQTLPRHLFEVILVDNGSTDRSVEIVRAFPQVTLLHEPRRDPYLARNCGIEAAKAPYVVFIDADCIPAAGWLEEINAAIARSHAPILLGYLAFPERRWPFLRRHEEYYHAKLEHLLQHRLHGHYFGHAGNMAVLRDLFDSIGLFPPMPVVGDTEIIHRMLDRWPGASVAYAPAARVIHAEVTSFRVCLQKFHECGLHSATLSRISNYRPLPLTEKLRILRRCVSANRYSFAALLESVFALLTGWVAFESGRLRVRAHPAPGAR
ncbi:MAG: glycosyltransferase family 2 protein [Bryobacterales bacterium]|nr:glycosyltransferase family 2 protein [Bryobacterales bacterium]